MKCQRCHRNYIESKSDKWDLSCPNTHGHVKLNKQGEVVYYRFYLYPTPGKRVTIEQSEYNNRLYMYSHTKVPQLKRNKKGQMIKGKATRERKSLIKMDKLIPVKLDDNQFLMVDKLYEKLKLYVLFS